MAPESKKLLIVAHAPSANTRALRDAVLRGAGRADIAGVEVIARAPLDAGPEDVRAADGVILGTTENLGYMAGAMKDFFDRTYYGVIEDKRGLAYALYVRAGQDGTGTLRAMDSIVTQGLGWRPICDPLLCRGAWDDAFMSQAEELGAAMAAGLEAGIF
ncbi:MAG: flavodoxin family protein [Rhodospirillales bacterium]